jgi:hypothetical protein
MRENVLVVITKGIPFESGGAAAIVRNLFVNVNNKSKVCLLGRKAEFLPSKNILPYDCFEIPLSNQSHNIFIKIFLFLKSLLIGIEIIKQKKATNILGIYRDESSLVLSYLISLFTKLPLSIYLTDLYAECNPTFFRKLLQKIIFAKAKNIFCLNEGMRQVYIDLYSIRTELLPHTINDLNNCYKKKKQSLNNEFIIGYAGTIVPDRIDLLEKLVEIIGKNVNYKLRLFTPHNLKFLKKKNLYNDSVSNIYINNHDILISELNKCDLLYLPLTFTNPKDSIYKLQLKSCLGTKSFDYLKSGSEILIHSPKEYLTYTFFEDNEIGFLLEYGEKNALSNKLDCLYKEIKASTFLSSDYSNILKIHNGEKVYNDMIKTIFYE